MTKKKSVDSKVEAKIVHDEILVQSSNFTKEDLETIKRRWHQVNYPQPKFQKGDILEPTKELLKSTNNPTYKVLVLDVKRKASHQYSMFSSTHYKLELYYRDHPNVIRWMPMQEVEKLVKLKTRTKLGNKLYGDKNESIE